MKQQALKAVMMLTLILTLAFVTAVVSANAQTPSYIKANVPFQFVIGDRMLPAGNYTVKGMTITSDAIQVRNEDGNTSAMRLTNTMEARASQQQAKMVFHRYGNQYYLAEVWDGVSNGRQLLSSSTERAIEREWKKRPQTELAINNCPETVTIIASLQ